MEEKGEGAECDAKGLSKLVLDCRSMLHNDGHNAGEVDVVACGPLLRLLGRKQSNTSADANKEEEGREEEREEEEGHWEQVKPGCRRWECGGPNDAFKYYLIH
jgi:hypothetical protein